MSNPLPDVGSKPHIRDTCLCFHAQRAARILARHFDEVFRPIGLTNGQFSLLAALDQAKAPTMGEVATGLGMDRTSLTAMLGCLVRGGLAQLEVDPTDQRRRRISLTAAGKSRLAEAMALWCLAHGEIEANLPTGEADRLRAALRRWS